MEKKTTLDELFSLQEKKINLCTIELIEKEEKLVKITPWLKDQGCMCSHALKIPRTFIKNVILTGETHYCCNKKLQVVEVEFTDDAKISVQEVLSSVLDNLSEKSHHEYPKQKDDFFFEHPNEYLGNNNFSCPSGYYAVSCGGRTYCVHNPGAVTCCGNKLCGSGQICSNCGGVHYCHYEIGSRCCGTSLCSPGQICVNGRCRYSTTYFNYR